MEECSLSEPSSIQAGKTGEQIEVAQLEGSTAPASQRVLQPKYKQPLFIVLGIFGAVLAIACIVIGIWLLSKPNSDENAWTSSSASPSSSPLPSTSFPSTTKSPSPTSPSPVAKRDISVRLSVANTSLIHLWMKAKQKGQEAVLYANLSSSTSPDRLLSTGETGWFEFFQLELAKDGCLEFSWSNASTSLSFLYVFEPENVRSAGIRPAFISEGAKGPEVPQSFHLRPPLGWQNDPNGFSRTKDGLFHLFYQHNPHNRRWEAMHWGHATSRDLVNWAHQPIFFRPEDKKCGNDCGWFSGSAVPLGQHGLQIFVTDHNKTRQVPQIQSSVSTLDTIAPSQKPAVIIDKMPANPRGDLTLTSDFRDPNVFLGPGGYFYMTLGSEDAGGKAGGVILLYRTRETRLDSEWLFQEVLLTDNSFGTEVCECSGLVPLGDPLSSYTYYALIYARMSSRDGDGRRNLSPILLGSFNGSQFSRIAEQELDFAAGSYGFQAFYDSIAQETLLIGWLANWPDWDGRSDFPSSMTLPRLIRRSGNTILMGPHPNVLKQLRGPPLDGQALLRGNRVALANGTAYVRLGINYNYFYNGIFLGLSHPDYIQLGVRLSYIGLEIVKVNRRGDEPNRRYMAWNAQPDIVHVFIDRDSLEVFGEKKGDGGLSRWAGTARLTGNGALFVEAIQLDTADRYNYVMNDCEVWGMRAAELLGQSWMPKST